jgi:hypothetical protein
MLVALLLSLIAGAPAAAVPQAASRGPGIEQAPTQQAVFVKRAQSLHALRAPQPTPFDLLLPGGPHFAAPVLYAASSNPVALRTPDAGRAERRPYQPRAPPAN